MSVVHIKTRSTGSEEVFNGAALSDKSALFIKDGLEPDHFSVELSVGEAWSDRYGPSYSQMHTIPSDGLHLTRHGSIVVQVAERIKVPHNMYGLIVPTGSLFLDRGVLIAPAKVEPSYVGYLKLRLFNTTNDKHDLKKGDKIASIIFFSTETTCFHPEITKKSIVVSKRIPIRKRLGRWASQSVNQIIGWVVSLAGGSLSAALVAYFVLKNHH
ncbi:dCTP deaminase domain-containing protein [Burkholderia gladioli]|uniref:dCTP deaminase domain-containing protein n=1 Tax=Burkholderia gladioli TaxID=28095 RepID=UPI00163FDE38|nr:dUTP pyrophosphatase [Burkholderia gladioli]